MIYTAHWDHFGRDETRQGDQIFNGARDNASGVAAMLEVAKAFTRLKIPPKRSICSSSRPPRRPGTRRQHYAGQPLYPLERTLAALNTDGINVYGPTRDIQIIGLDKSSLGEQLSALAARRGRVAKGDLMPKFGLFYRSDHKEFAAAGVPSLWMRRGFDYIGKPADFVEEGDRGVLRQRLSPRSATKCATIGTCRARWKTIGCTSGSATTSRTGKPGPNGSRATSSRPGATRC